MSRLGDLSLLAANRLVGIAPGHIAPAARAVHLPGRGTTWVTDLDDQRGEHGDDTGEARPTLILLHALATTGQLCWYPVMRHLSEHYRVVTFDQRGHGRGIRSDEFRLEDCADDVVAVADALAVEQFIAVGYSMGSLIGPLAWRRHPDRVAGLVLGAAAHSFRHNRRHRVAHSLVTAASTARARREQSPLPPLDEAPVQGDERWAYNEFRSTRPAAVGDAITEIMRYDIRPWAHQIDVPTSLVITRHDRLITSDRQRWLAQQIPNATAYEIDAGHAACVLQAELFRPALMVACASVRSRLTPASRQAQ